jgi:magnesium transporter
MTRFIKKRSKTIGLSPGSMVHIGKKKIDEVNITVIDYNEKKVEEEKTVNVEDCYPFKEKPSITWINVVGLHDVDKIEKLGNHYNIHPLVLEDIVNTSQRPKMEDFDDYLYIVFKMLHYDEQTDEVEAEQVSFILGNNFVICFQEKEEDVFDSIRERIRNDKGRIRKMKADYLCYVLIDAIIDNYFIILEHIGDKVEGMEEELVSNPKPVTLQAIHHLKRELLFLRKSVWPLREVVSGLQRDESHLINESLQVFLRDLYDHTIQVIDTIETFRDMISGMLDIYMSSVSNKMNEVMKVLTIFAAIFIPLTFVAGIYGMNFNPEASPFNMPELGWYWGYPMVWAILIVMSLVMILFFKRKKWL